MNFVHRFLKPVLPFYKGYEKRELRVKTTNDNGSPLFFARRLPPSGPKAKQKRQQAAD